MSRYDQARTTVARQMEHVAHVIVILAMLGTVYLYSVQIMRIRSKIFNGDLALPLCRTLADVLAAADEPSELYAALETGRFRSCNLSVYDEHGEVFLDSQQPCYGKLPMAPSERQRQTFGALREKGVLTSDDAVETSLFRQCRPTSVEYDTNTICGMHLKSRKLVVVVDSCGSENV